MRIGINCLSIVPSYVGGVNTYLFGLLDGFAKAGNRHVFQLYVNEDNSYMFEQYAKSINFEIILIPTGPFDFFKKLVRRISLYTRSTKVFCKVTDLLFGEFSKIMDKNSDVIYIPTTILFPYVYRKPTVLSMHDIQQIHYPHFFSKTELLMRKVTYAISAEKATYIQASSEFIKQDLLRNYNVLNPNQIVVIPEGVSINKFSNRNNPETIFEKYGLPKDYLFFPAQLWLHKNHITVLKALNKLRQEHGVVIPLVMTGAKGSGAEGIFSFIKEYNMDYVYYLGKVPFEDIVALYQCARLFITAVLYESSSLPVLEAAAAGCPIITSDTPSNKEMNKRLNYEMFEPLNDDLLAKLLRKIWFNPILYKEMTNNNAKLIEFFSWENAARKYLDFFESRVECHENIGKCRL